MSHASIADASKLHGAKPNSHSELPLWGGTGPSFSAEFAVDADSGAGLFAYDSTEGEAGWYVVRDPTRRLGALTAFPQTVSGGGEETYPGFGFCAPRMGTSGVEANGGGDYVAYATLATAVGTTTNLHLIVPLAFTGWDANGIRVLCRIAGAATATLEVMDPATGTSFGTPKVATRTAGSAEGSYDWLTISAATLASDFAAGDLLIIQLSTDDVEVRFSALECNWT